MLEKGFAEKKADNLLPHRRVPGRSLTRVVAALGIRGVASVARAAGEPHPEHRGTGRRDPGRITDDRGEGAADLGARSCRYSGKPTTSR